MRAVVAAQVVVASVELVELSQQAARVQERQQLVHVGDADIVLDDAEAVVIVDAAATVERIVFSAFLFDLGIAPLQACLGLRRFGTGSGGITRHAHRVLLAGRATTACANHAHHLQLLVLLLELCQLGATLPQVRRHGRLLLAHLRLNLPNLNFFNLRAREVALADAL